MAYLKIAQSGGDVLDSNKDLAFTSDVDYMIILEERTDTSDSSGDLVIAHDLGYIPAFYNFYESSSGTWTRSLSSPKNTYADSSNIYITTPSGSQRVRTVIFGNSQSNEVGTDNDNASGKVKVIKDTYDISSDTDIRQFLFTSGHGVFKIVEKRTMTVSVTGNDGDFTSSYSHGLGYAPQVYAFVDGLQIPSFYFVGAGVSYTYSIEVNDTNVIATVTNVGGGITPTQAIDFNVHILGDKID